jgi:GT2 family glycosyltransferase
MSRIKAAVIKVRNNPRLLPHLIAKNAKDLIRPTYRKAKISLRQAKGIVRRSVDKTARELHKEIQNARDFYQAYDWLNAQLSFNEIINKYTDNAPLEAHLKLALSQSGAGKHDEAEATLNNAVDFVYARWGGVTQATLVDWLEISRVRAEVSFAERITRIDQYRDEIKKYNHKKQTRRTGRPKIAIVSAISGGYDDLNPPAKLDSRFDYIVFTDLPIQDFGIYDVRPMPYIDGDTTRSARYVKANLANLLPEYDYAVWVDANIAQTGDFAPIVQKFINSGKDVSAMRHPLRSSPYEEMKECIKKNKDDVDAITSQRDQYVNESYSTDRLIESNLLFFNLNSKAVEEFFEIWWNQIDKYSRRDQFSINYSLDKAGIDWSEVFEYPNTVRNRKDLALVPHGQNSKIYRQLVSKLKSNTVNPFDPKNTYSKHKKRKQELDKTVDVVVCVHNAYDDVEKCLASIEEYRTEKLNLIIVDDGSGLQTQEYLKEFADDRSWVKLVRNKNTHGYTKSANIGLSKSKADLVILLNSDTVVTRNWHLKMVEAIYSVNGAGIVGPLSSSASTQSIPEINPSSTAQTAINNLPEDMSVSDMNNFCEEIAVNYYPIVPLVHGFCMGITREVLSEVGLFDEKSFPRGYGEETDYCFRAANAGYKLVLATNTYVFHSKSKSFNSSDERARLMKEGAIALAEKHTERRVSRSVLTMENNPVLIRMRHYATRLNAKKFIDAQRDTFPVVSVPGSKILLSDMTYPELQDRLTELNTSLIKWDELNGIKRKKKISIIVLVFGQYAMTERCIRSVLNAKNKQDMELIVVDNGSDLNTVKKLVKFARNNEIKLVLNDQNLNYALGNNIGFSFAQGEKVVFLNNDTIVTDGWLDALTLPFRKRDVHITQPLLLYPDKSIQSMGTVFSEKTSLGYALYAHQSSKNKKIINDRRLQSVTGACLAIKAEDFTALQGFDTSFINGQEDTDLCMRLKVKSDVEKPCYVATSSIVYHDESKTPGRGKNVYANRTHFIARWRETVTSDDEAIYLEDGMAVKSYKSDNMLDAPLFRAIFKKR